MKNNSQTQDQENNSQSLNTEWQEWIDHNLDRNVEPESLIRVMVEEGFDEEFSRQCVNEAIPLSDVYANFIEQILPDFNDVRQNKLNMNLLRDFLDQQKAISTPEEITQRLETQWFALDNSCRDFAIRERKIAFFHAMDFLILAYGYDFPYPDPVRFSFFPAIQFDEKLSAKTADLVLNKNDSEGFYIPITTLSDKNLSLSRDANSRAIFLGSGTYGKVRQGLFGDQKVALKFLQINQIEYGLKWQKILSYYRQSKIVLEYNFEGVLPMLELFFFEEKSVFSNDYDRLSIVAVYPLCEDTLYDRVEGEEKIFTSYASLKPMKEILQSLVVLHESSVCVHDFVAQNILFDEAGKVYLHDFDYWLPSDIASLKSSYIQRNVIGSGYTSVQELDFLLDGSIEKIFPKEIDVWCFAILLLSGLGHLSEIENIRRKSSEALRNSADKENLDDESFISNINQLKINITNLCRDAIDDVVNHYDRAENSEEKEFWAEFHEVLSNCLIADPNSRWNTERILSSALFQNVK